MKQRQRRWTDVLLGAAAYSALFTAVGYVGVLLGFKSRGGQPWEASLLPVMAIIGAFLGALNTWRTGHFLGERNPWADRTDLGRAAVEPTEASSGQPNEPKATRTVATMAVIPAAICGVFLGTQLVGETAPPEQLWLVCGGLAFGVGGGVLVAVWAVYQVFGFRPVVVLAAALLGGFTGILIGVFLGKVFDSWWPWLMGPFGVLIAVVTALVIVPAAAASGDRFR